MNNEPVVQLRGVTKRIGFKTIIDRISFDVPRGEVFGLLGPNGAGKTTTIRMMVGLMSITEGEIIIEGRSIRTHFEQAIRRVGAIVENPEMYKFLSGYRNLVHFARMTPGVSEARIREVISLVGLENRIDEKVRTYSLGMRQRLGVAQALLHKPSLLILDEPTNGLDPAGIRELRDHLRRLAREEGISVIVSSHLLSEMELMCDRIAVMQTGKLIDVRHIGEFVKEEGAAKVLFEIEPGQLAEAERTIRAAAIEAQASPDPSVSGGLLVTVERERIADVNAALVSAGIRVSGIRPVTKSLEDKFLEITGRDSIA
ncbi:bacitracin ABC transporter ATP-binding protein [Gordoniibacillus kamchatkensis]|uniref:Bacitracin ABC transporter ATP-binding protein n=1 Tax=Gordoniibacillus kamchatkensis TaxID=1590651 RepID=A0ABR5AGF6_9BACL|nr:bacitracin ABC transporter ATP-binding protein [Paenibacillus sp. VKM B-2647]